jgi:choline dehydrogenase-like flavoprotein
MERFDFIIIGAGSAGCVLANRLSADKHHSVLLLEAGGEDSRPLMAMPLAWRESYKNPDVNWGYTSEPEPHAAGRRVAAHRGKVLGGTSSVNGMLYARGTASDYDRWGALGLSGWSYREVLPYFLRSEANWRGKNTYHGADGPMTVSRHAPDKVIHPRLIQTAKALGYRHLQDFHAQEAEGFGTPDFTVHHGTRVSTATAFLRPALHRSNLTVRLRAFIQRLLLKEGRAIGVEYEIDGQVRRACAAAEIILSAGTFNSPQILLLSGIGPAAELQQLGIAPLHDLRGVGKSLQDHHAVGHLYATRAPIAFESRLRVDRMLMSAVRWWLFRTGDGAGVPLSALGFYRSQPDLAWPDVQFVITPVSMTSRLWFPGWRHGIGHVLAAASVLLRPDSRGEVTLRSKDPHDKPKIRFNLLNKPTDRDSFRRMVHFAQRFFATPPTADLVSRLLEPNAELRTDTEIDTYVRSTVSTAMHPTSTCAMGVGSESVLDSQCRVRGLQGLRVVDASVMPTIVGGNTNAPVIMIAEKASDMILGHLPLPASSIQADRAVGND